MTTLQIYPVGQKFVKKLEIERIGMRNVHPKGSMTFALKPKEIEANLCFCIFGKNLKIQNGLHFGGRENFFENCQKYIALIPCGSKISTKSLYIAWLRR